MSDSRKRTTWDKSVGDREWLLEQVRELAGGANESQAIEYALKCAIDLHDLLEQRREELRRGRIDLEYHRVNVQTEIVQRDR